MILCFLFAALIVALDQFFKQWIVRSIALGATGPDIIPGILGLTHWENDGAMLNILSGQQWLLAGIAFAAAVALVMILLRYNEGFWGTIGLTGVLGGTVGNLCDRVFNDGKVIDMFRTLFINFPIFNIADIFITLGFITFLIHFIVLTFKVSKSEDAIKDSKRAASAQQIPAQDSAPIDITDINKDYGQAADTDYSAAADINISDIASVVASQQEYAPAPQEYAAVPVPQPDVPAAVLTPEPAPADDYYAAIPDDYDSITDTTPEISLTMEALEAEFGSLDVEDYDVDELLREYGLEDDDFNV